MMINPSNFYLKTPMARQEYMRLKIMDILEEIIKQYKLRDIVTPDKYVYCKIKKGMYGIPQSRIIAQQLLKERLGKVRYTQNKIIPGLWKHQTQAITFCLVVDDFSIKYTKKEDVDHLLNVLKNDYEVTDDWMVKNYLKLTIEWDYDNQKVHLWMPGYIKKALLRFKHHKPKKMQNSPHPHTIPDYGNKIQYTADKDNTPKLGKDDTQYIQQVSGMLLYYARAVNSTILPALSSIATGQAAPTAKTMAKVKQLFDYVSTQQEAIITYRASDMILSVHSNAGYCIEKKAQSQAGGHFYFSNNDPTPPNNRAILTIATIIKNVMSLVAEAELGALYLNVKETIY